MKKNTIVMHCSMSPEAVSNALCRNMDAEQRMLFSFSGCMGDQGVVGEVWGNSIHLQKRGHRRNDFASHFYGTLQPEPGGTRMEGYFASSEFVRWFMWIWRVAAIAIGSPLFVASLSGAWTGHHRIEEDDWTGVIVPPALIVWGFVLPWLGRLMDGGSSETYLREHLQHVLAARIDPADISPVSAINP